MSAGTELAVLDSKWNLGCLVTVKAQVMTRDDSTGMWVPLSGGGMSVVSLHRVLAPRGADDDSADDDDDVNYVILGQRIADRSVALNCELLSDFQYTSVNPTFHHWTTDNKRFGLTFQTSSDATAFQKGIQKLLKKMKLEDSGSDLQLDKMTPENTEISVQSSTALKESEAEQESSDTFTNEGRSRFPPEQAPKTTPRMPCITPQIFIKQPQLPATQLAHLRNKPPPNILSQVPPTLGSSSPPGVTDKTTGITLGDYGFYVDVSTNGAGLDGTQSSWSESDARDIGRKVRRLSIPSDEADDLIYFSGSYVQFARNDPEKHDYCYPSLDTFKFPPYGTMPRSPYAESQQVHLSTPVPVPIPIKSRHRWLRWKRPCAAAAAGAHLRPQKPVRKSRCAYCDEFFTPEENFRGACKDAPDRILACIKAATCVCCRDAVLYHCKGREEDEDNAVNEGLDCRDRRGGCRRRVITVLICLMVPCLWCYLPLRACHRLGVSCQCCGPRHKAAR